MKEADLDISELMAGYCSNPTLVICEVEVSRWPTLAHSCSAGSRVPVHAHAALTAGAAWP